jgi:hypothetical protein
MNTFNAPVELACEQGTTQSPSLLKRLSRTEYALTLKELFKLETIPNIDSVPGDPSQDNFTNIAALQQFAPSHLTAYINLATSLTTSLLNNADRHAQVIGCDVQAASCLTTFVQQFGRLAYRRPLTTAETSAILATITQSGLSGPDALIMASQLLLTSPNFIFRVEIGNSPEGLSQLDEYELASRLAFSLWGQGPSAELLDMASRGDLNSAVGLRNVALTMLADDRAKSASSAFFEQWLAVERLRNYTPSPAPQGWFDGIVDQFWGETDRLIQEFAWTANTNFMGVFTANHTHLSPQLAAYYGVPYDVSTGVTVSPEASTLRVVASGTGTSALIQLLVDDVAVVNWPLTTTPQEYVFNGLTGQRNIKIYFTDDNSDATVDYIVAGGIRLESENQPVNTSLYINNACVTTGGFSASLQCPGYIDFGTLNFGPEYSVVNLPGNDPRRGLGILGHALNTAAKSDGDLISIRGNWFRSTFLCEHLEVPSSVNALIMNGLFDGLTKAEILAERNDEPSCKVCHARIDPIGMVFNVFDKSGRFDTNYDASLEAVVPPAFPYAPEFGVESVHDIAAIMDQLPAVGECMAERMFIFMRNREPTIADQCFVEKAGLAFQDSGFDFVALLLAFIDDSTFRQRVAPTAQTGTEQ